MTQTEFNKLANQWDDEIGHFSMWHQMRRHPIAQQFVDMGTEVIPFIIRRLRTKKNINWSQLLCEITGMSPYKPTPVAGGIAAFNVDAFAKAWVQWGKENGYVTDGPIPETKKKDSNA